MRDTASHIDALSALPEMELLDDNENPIQPYVYTNNGQKMFSGYDKWAWLSIANSLDQIAPEDPQKESLVHLMAQGLGLPPSHILDLTLHAHGDGRTRAEMTVPNFISGLKVLSLMQYANRLRVMMRDIIHNPSEYASHISDDERQDFGPCAGTLLTGSKLGHFVKRMVQGQVPMTTELKVANDTTQDVDDADQDRQFSDEEAPTAVKAPTASRGSMTLKVFDAWVTAAAFWQKCQLTLLKGTPSNQQLLKHNYHVISMRNKLKSTTVTLKLAGR